MTWQRPAGAATPCCGTSPCSAKPQASSPMKSRNSSLRSTGSSPPACGTGSSTATGPSTWTSSTPPPPSNCQSSPPHCAWSSTRKASRPGSPRHDRKRTLRHYAVALRAIGGRWDRGLADGATEGVLHFLGVGLRIDLDYPEAAGDVDAAEPLGYRQVVPRRLLGAERGDIGGVTVAQRALSLPRGRGGRLGARVAMAAGDLGGEAGGGGHGGGLGCPAAADQGQHGRLWGST